MLNALIADELLPRPEGGGINAVCGSAVYTLDMSERDRQRLLEQADARRLIYCDLELRDERFRLAGFSSIERRDLYRSMISISGIGRRSALLALDCGEARDLLCAVASDDSRFFKSVPGLGKTRIVSLIAGLKKKYKGLLPPPLEIPVAEFVQAREALVSGGLDARDAERQLREAAAEAPSRTAEDLIKRVEGGA